MNWRPDIAYFKSEPYVLSIRWYHWEYFDIRFQNLRLSIGPIRSLRGWALIVRNSGTICPRFFWTVGSFGIRSKYFSLIYLRPVMQRSIRYERTPST